MTKKNPSHCRKGLGQNNFVEYHSTLAFHPSIDRLTLQPWTKSRSLMIDAFIADRSSKQLDLFSIDSSKPQNIRSVGIEPSCKHCGCKRGYLYKGKFLCCRCDRQVKGGSN